MKEVIYEILCALTKEKEIAKILPSYVLDIELRNTVDSEVNNVLKDMYKDGSIVNGRLTVILLLYPLCQMKNYAVTQIW